MKYLLLFLNKYFSNFKIKERLAISLIILIPLLLSVVWFRNGKVLGTGESALPFYNLDSYRTITAHVWNENILGGYLGNEIASAPTYWTLSKIQDFGVKGFIVEASVFALLFIISGLAIYKLTKEILPETKPPFLLLAVLFYWFNPISLVNVWGRFLYNYMFFWALLPLFLYLVIKGLNKKDYKYTIFSALSTLFLSYALSNPVFTIMIWSITLMVIIYYLLRDGKNTGFYLKYFFFSILNFALFNFWWINQYFSFLVSSGYKDSVSSFFSERGNLYTLDSLSEGLGKFVYTLSFIHSTFVQKGPLWARIYNNPAIRILEYLIPFIIFWVIYKYRKQKEILFLAVGFLLSIFLLKGSNPPFGNIFLLMFTKIPFFQVFRNPFEKFGFLLALFATPLVGFGLQKLIESSKPKALKFMISFLGIILIVAIYGFPFWSGLVFSSNEGVALNDLRTYEVVVPDYYKSANNWLNQKGDDSRFIVFPLGGEGITYNWEKPFIGVELSSSLFDRSNLSLNTTIPYYTDIASVLEKVLIKGEDLSKIASLLDTKYILLRKDIDWRIRKMRDPGKVEEALSLNKDLKKEVDFGSLSVYSFSNTDTSKIWIPEWGMKVSPQNSIEDYLVTSDSSKGFMYSDANLNLPNTDKVLIKPNGVSYIPQKNSYTVDSALSSLLDARFLPGSPFYPFILLKEKVERSQISAPEGPFVYDVTHLGKRMVELYKLANKNSSEKIVDSAINNYFKELDFIKAYYNDQLSSKPDNRFWPMVIDEFNKQAVLMDNIAKNGGSNQASFEKANSKFTDEMINLGIETRYRFVTNLATGQEAHWVYRYNVNEPGNYDLLLENNSFKNFYNSVNNNLEFQMNDKVMHSKMDLHSGYMELGNYHFDKGYYELSFSEPVRSNLLDNKDDSYAIQTEGVNSVSFIVNNFDPFANYQMSFDYLIKKGKSFSVYVTYDNEPPAKIDEDIFQRVVASDIYDHGYRNENFVFAPRDGSTQMKVTFVAAASNYCVQQSIIFGSSCKNPSYSRLFDKPTEVNISNLSLKKVFDNNLVLFRKVSSETFPLPSISYVEKNPTEYEISIKNSTSPYTLIFSELFNSGWKLYQSDGVEISKNHFLANSYANGWLVDKKGDYQLILKFAPESLYQKGVVISLVSILLVVVLFVILKFRKKAK